MCITDAKLCEKFPRRRNSFLTLAHFVIQFIVVLVVAGNTIIDAQMLAGALQSKRLILLRHGQALHNPRAEVARTAGCSFEEFLRLMKEDDALDAALTELGRGQARQACRDVKGGSEAALRIELLVSSPLSRALETASLAFPEAAATSFLCLEHLREINGLLLNGQRIQRSALIKRFPTCDFSDLTTEDDATWTQELEADASVVQRGYNSLRVLCKRPERCIAICAHGGLFHKLLNDHPLVEADEATRRRFGNAELRTCTMSWTEGEGEPKIQLSAASLNGDA